MNITLHINYISILKKNRLDSHAYLKSQWHRCKAMTWSRCLANIPVCFLGLLLLFVWFSVGFLLRKATHPCSANHSWQKLQASWSLLHSSAYHLSKGAGGRGGEAAFPVQGKPWGKISWLNGDIYQAWPNQYQQLLTDSASRTTLRPEGRGGVSPTEPQDWKWGRSGL